MRKSWNWSRCHQLTNKPGRFSPLRANNDLLQACFTALAGTSRARPGNFDKVAPSKPWAIGIINARDTFIAPAERGKFDRSQPRMGHEKEKQAIRAQDASFNKSINVSANLLCFLFPLSCQAGKLAGRRPGKLAGSRPNRVLDLDIFAFWESVGDMQFAMSNSPLYFFCVLPYTLYTKNEASTTPEP